MEHVYITYKNDRNFYNNEKELYIMVDLQELDKSYNKDKKISNILEEKQVELELVYDLEKLHKLI